MGIMDILTLTAGIGSIVTLIIFIKKEQSEKTTLKNDMSYLKEKIQYKNKEINDIRSSIETTIEKINTNDDKTKVSNERQWKTIREIDTNVNIVSVEMKNLTNRIGEMTGSISDLIKSLTNISVLEERISNVDDKIKSHIVKDHKGV